MFKVRKMIWRVWHLVLTHFICKFWEVSTLQDSNGWNVLKMSWFLILPFEDLFRMVELMFLVGYRVLLLSIWKDLFRHTNVRKQSVHRANVFNWIYPAYHYAIVTGTSSCIELNTLFKLKIYCIHLWFLLDSWHHCFFSSQNNPNSGPKIGLREFSIQSKSKLSKNSKIGLSWKNESDITLAVPLYVFCSLCKFSHNMYSLKFKFKLNLMHLFV